MTTASVIESLPCPSLQCADRAEWLGARRLGLGASDAAVLLGLSSWATPLELYLQKTGAAPPTKETPLMEWGTRLQGAIAEKFSDETGLAIYDCTNVILMGREPLLASLDYITSGGLPVEIKKVSYQARKSWGESETAEIPAYYMPQVQQQLLITRKSTAYVAALIGDTDFRWYVIDADGAMQDRIVTAATDFWRRVESSDPPLPDFSHPTTAAALRRVDADEDKAAVLDEHAENWVALYVELGERIASMKTDRNAAEARILHALGDAAEALLPDGRKVRRTKVLRKAHRVAASEHWRLTIR